MYIIRLVMVILPTLALGFASPQAKGYGLSIDAMYLKVGDIEQKSISATQVIGHNSALRPPFQVKAFAEYFSSGETDRWKMGANGNLAGIDLSYLREPKKLQAELGLTKKLGWGFSMGFLWRSQWRESRWIPNEQADDYAVMKILWGRQLIAKGMPIDLLAENKQIAGQGETFSEWRLLGDIHIKKLFVRVERRWDLSKIAIGIKL